MRTTIFAQGSRDFAAALIGLAFGAMPDQVFAVAWNATDPTVSAVSTGGLGDNYGQFTNESVINNNDISARGTCTYLNNGWFLTALHVVSTSSYGTLAPASQISINVYGTNYTADNFVTWGSADVAMVHVSGYTMGTLPSLTGVEARQIGPTGNGLCQIGGFGLWGPLNSTMNSSVAFHRAFTVPFPSSPFVYTNAGATRGSLATATCSACSKAAIAAAGCGKTTAPATRTST